MGKLLEHTKRFTFEINNQCVYAYQHKKCPVSKNKEPQTLPEKIVYDVFDFMAKEKFEGRVSFHNYNETMTDPRLFLFLDRLKKVCPKCYIFILTNAWNLDQQMLNELANHGVKYVEVSAYNEEESVRVRERVIQPKGMTYRVMTNKVLDDRMDIYTGKEVKCRKMCYAPLTEIVIRSSGKIDLCCFDWDGQVTFGDLNKESIRKILERGDMLKVYNELKEGEREFDICKRCGRWREESVWAHKYGQDKQ